MSHRIVWAEGREEYSKLRKCELVVGTDFNRHTYESTNCTFFHTCKRRNDSTKEHKHLITIE